MNPKGKFKVPKKNKSGKFNEVNLAITPQRKLSKLSKKYCKPYIKVKYTSSNGKRSITPSTELMSIQFETEQYTLTVDDFTIYPSGFIRMYVYNKELTCSLYVCEQDNERTEETSSMNDEPISLLPCSLSEMSLLTEEEDFQYSLICPHWDWLKSVGTEVYNIFNACVDGKTNLMTIVQSMK